MMDFTRAKRLFEKLKMKDTGRGFYLTLDQKAIMNAWLEMGRVLKSDQIDSALASEQEAIMPLVLDSQAVPDAYNLWVFFKAAGQDGEFAAAVVHDFIGKDISGLLSMTGEDMMRDFVYGVRYQVEFLTGGKVSCGLTGTDDKINFSLMASAEKN